MKPFVQVAIPHQDVREGKITMDTFAADLWQVVKGRAPLDYQDPDVFFKKTYMTKGLKNILDVAKARLLEGRGDSVIQLQTPFGGGKTHALIALYHKAKEWGVNTVVFVGLEFHPEDTTPWEEIEKQLEGKASLLKGETSPGKERLREVLQRHTPVMILMDEILEYTTKANSIRVGESTLSAQLLAFMQELTETVSSMDRALLVVTLPSSLSERYDESSEKLFQQLQKISGRVERIYTPVEEDEVASVVRRRLFEHVDEETAREIVDEFIDHAKSEGILSGDDLIIYREKFLKSYPFKPDVIDTLYRQWGSFPNFQRTRGVLRLLAMVVRSVLVKNIPFIRLGDFDLSNEEIRRELLKHIGNEYDSVLAQDITSKDSGAKKIDDSIQSAYKPYKLGTVVSTTIFMKSFSGKGVVSANPADVKLSVLLSDIPSSIVDTVISNLRDRLFYLADDELRFTTQPNLNKIIVDRQLNVTEDEIHEEERNILRRYISSAGIFRVYIHPKFPRDIPDTPDLKLVVINGKEPDPELLEKCGEAPRVYKNTLVFLCKDEDYQMAFENFLRELIALRHIEADKKLRLSESQKRELKRKIEDAAEREYEELRKLYRKLYLPSKDGFDLRDMGHTTLTHSRLDEEVYDFLKQNGKIIEKISPYLILTRYLNDKDFIETRILYEMFLKTPGEVTIVSKDALIRSIKKGAEEGLFAVGYLDDEGKPVCKEDFLVELEEGEIILKSELCKKEREEAAKEQALTEEGVSDEEYSPPVSEKSDVRTPQEDYKGTTLAEVSTAKESLDLEIDVPFGALLTVQRIIEMLLQERADLEVKVTITARNARITREDENKILEACEQAGIKIIRME